MQRGGLKQRIRYRMSFRSINKALSSVNDFAYLPALLPTVASFHHYCHKPSHWALQSLTQNPSPSCTTQSPFSWNQLPAATDSPMIKVEWVAVRTQRMFSHLPKPTLILTVPSLTTCAHQKVCPLKELSLWIEKETIPRKRSGWQDSCPAGCRRHAQMNSRIFKIWLLQFWIIRGRPVSCLPV